MDTPLSPTPSPAENPHLLGHEQAEKKLLQAFHKNCLPHAWLISGPLGVGKATLAYRFARYILMQSETDFALFNTIPSGTGDKTDMFVDQENPVFRKIAAGGHGNLHVLERARAPETGKHKVNISIGQIREVEKFLSLTAAENGWRIVIIDSADDMNIHASNGLLKILEEPPEKSLLLLVSHNPSRLLPTIHSRCCRLGLSPLRQQQVLSLVEQYYPDINQITKEAAMSLMAGSPGQTFDFIQKEGYLLYRELITLLMTLGNLDISQLHAFLDKILASCEPVHSFAMLTTLIKIWLKRLIVFLSCHSKGMPSETNAKYHDLEKTLACDLAGKTSLDVWFRAWDDITSLLDRSWSIHLNHKQVSLNIFTILDNAVQSQPRHSAPGH